MERSGEQTAVPSKDQIQRQVEKIASSGGFVGSEALRSVLLYLAQQALDHPGRTVKEYEIATQALGRDADFDSRFDSTVRSIASRLRSKLAEYYLAEGSNDPVLIALPKGSYALTFSLFGKERLITPPFTEAPISEKTQNRPGTFERLLWVAGIVLFGVVVFLGGRHSIRPAGDGDNDIFGTDS